MIIKGLVDEDFINYKKPSMVIMFPTCNFKCGKEFCHNKDLIDTPNIIIDERAIVRRYVGNPITSAIIFSGMEPFDSSEDVFSLIECFRRATDDDIVIYTGYTKDKLKEHEIYNLRKLKNIIVKFGRYLPKTEPIYDKILGVTLASNNQYAERME